MDGAANDFVIHGPIDNAGCTFWGIVRLCLVEISGSKCGRQIRFPKKNISGDSISSTNSFQLRGGRRLATFAARSRDIFFGPIPLKHSTGVLFLCFCLWVYVGLYGLLRMH